MALLRLLRDPGRPLNPRACARATFPAQVRRRVVLLLFVLTGWACAPTPEPPSDPELRQALGVDDARTIHRVTLGGRGAVEHVTPRHLEVDPGDLVQFAPVDRRVHTITFEGDRLSAAAGDFLDRTRQRSSPPLIDSDSRFVVSFEEAPPGAYPFTSTGHGAPAGGLIVVREDPARTR